MENVLNDIEYYNKVEFDDNKDFCIIDYNKDSRFKYFKEKLVKVLKKLLKNSIRIKHSNENYSLKIDLKSIRNSDNIGTRIIHFIF